MTTSTVTLLDPTAETAPVARERVAPPEDLATSTVGLLCISKRRSDEFLDHVERHLSDRGLQVRRFAKPSHSKPAPESVIQDIVDQCDVVVEALAD